VNRREGRGWPRRMEASLRPRFLVYFLLILQLILLNLWPILFHLVSEVEAQLGKRLQVISVLLLAGGGPPPPPARRSVRSKN